jgi:hypothetical protein
MADNQLQIALSAAVPLWILEKKKLPLSEVLQRIPYCIQMITEHGDNFLFLSKKKRESAKAFNAVAEAIAILSFAPGGVTIFGNHWESKHPGTATIP